MNIKKWTNSILFKMILTSFVALLILIPIGKVSKLLAEREFRKDTVKNEVIQQWGGRQYIAGPIMVIPVNDEHTEIIEGKKETRIIRHVIYILPEELNIKGDIDSEVRHKGIYNIELYTGKFEISGYFSSPDISELSLNKPEILFDEAEIVLGLGDSKGLSRKIKFKWNNTDLDFKGGTGEAQMFISGISADIPSGTGHKNFFHLSMELKGGESISFLPLGDETTVMINSDWQSPDFQGIFLPETRKLTNTGFSAVWKIYALSRNFPRIWMDDEVLQETLNASEFGVNFFSPVDGYFKNHRAIKYSLLFIFIPFIALFMFEVFTKVRIHPIQYFLVGLAVSLFFLLLLSLSEHLSFYIAYILSASASTLLVSVYTGFSFRSLKSGTSLAVINVLLYIYLYMALASEDYALLIGSIGLFIILSFIMLITRRIDWYNLS